jgi:hypothetical protein
MQAPFMSLYGALLLERARGNHATRQHASGLVQSEYEAAG